MVSIKFNNVSKHVEKIMNDREVETLLGSISANEPGLEFFSNERNPRKAGVNTKQGKNIQTTVVATPSEMYFSNNGIYAFIEGDYTYDAANKTLNAERIYIMDGGTTHACCMRVKEQGHLSDDCILKIEILTTKNITKKEISAISVKRNTSNPPVSYTIANSVGAFDVLQTFMTPEYREKIVFIQNDKKPNNIIINEVLTYLIMLDILSYSSFDNPSNTLFPNHKGDIIKKANNALIEGSYSYDFMGPIVNDVLRVHDKLFVDLTKKVDAWVNSDLVEIPSICRYIGIPKKYKDFLEENKYKPNSKVYISMSQEIKEYLSAKKVTKTIFTNEDYKYRLCKQCLYVFFSGLRVNLRYDETTNQVKWIKELDTILEESIKILWDKLSAKFELTRGAGMDVLCKPDVAEDIYKSIKLLVTYK